MNDDAEFAAFLKGEDDVSRRLQAMPQPEPPPELDAVIMKRVRFAQAQRAREAANDPGLPEPRLGGGSGAKWRMPVGIAASVLVGVLATQLYEGSARPGYEPPAEQAVMVNLPREEVPQAPPPAVIVAQSDAMAPAPPPKPAAKVAREAGVVAGLSSVDAPGLPVATPPPPPPELEGSPASMAPAAAPAAAPAPAPAASHYAQAQRSVDYVANKAEEAALKRVDITGSRIRVVDAIEPAAWVQKIEALLAAGKDAEALAEWEKFRKINPYYLVPAATQAKIEAISR